MRANTIWATEEVTTYSGTSERILGQGVQALEAFAARSMGLDDWLDRKAPPELRRTMSSLLFTFFRKKRAVDAALTNCWTRPPRPELAFLLELTLTLAVFQQALRPESAVNIAVATAKRRFGAGAGKFANAVLRRALAQLSQDAPAMALLPEAIARRWQNACGMEVAAARAELFQRQVPTTARWRRGFEAEIPPDAEIQPLPWPCRWRFSRMPHPEKAAKDELFRRGAYYFQDPAPAAVAMLLEHPELPEKLRVLDLCAAPGGKLLLAEEILTARGVAAEFTALDRSEKRQQLTRDNLSRCGVEAVVKVGDAENWLPDEGTGKFDLVLADVPCTNSGVFRRRPDALWRWSEAGLRAMAELQSGILLHAAELCAAGGLILYSTCSLEHEENGGQVAAFLRQRSDFALQKALLLEPAMEHDAAYGALLRKER